MGKRDMERELHALRSGEMTADQFARETEPHWNRMAKVLYARWPLPPSVDEEDIRQEMILAALEPKPRDGRTLMEKWDPQRATKLSRYVVFNAHADTTKEIHRLRDSPRRRGTEEGRFPVAMSVLRPDAAWWTDDADGDDGEAAERLEERTAAREMLRSAIRRLSREDGLLLRVLLLVGGDVDAAAEKVDESFALSLACGVGSKREARERVERAMQSAAEVLRSKE